VRVVEILLSTIIGRIAALLPRGRLRIRYRLRIASLKPTVAELEQRRRLFENLPLDPQHAEWFRHRAWIRTIHGTTRIEGNSLNALEVEDVLVGAGSAVSRKDALEVLGGLRRRWASSTRSRATRRSGSTSGSCGTSTLSCSTILTHSSRPVRTAADECGRRRSGQRDLSRHRHRATCPP